MGFRISWVAVRGGSEATLAALGVQPTGEAFDVPDYELSMVELDPWLVLVEGYAADFSTFGTLEKALHATAVAQFPIVAVSVDEGTMHALATYYENGQPVWSVEHNAQRAPDDLRTTGALPANFAQIRDRLTKEQNEDPDVDTIFDIPVELAESIVSFRHDRGDHDFLELEALAS